MWQALLTAAVAASTGLLAGKHIFNFKPTADSDSDSDRNPKPHPNPSIAPAFQSQTPPWETSDGEDQQKGTIFRFSSEASSSRGSGRATRFRLRKRTGSLTKAKKAVERSNGGEQRKKKAVGVSLKKRKTGKNVAASTAAAPKDTSLFSWGLNVGIMYMMSAGKAEINKLNTAMDETARVVQEIKSELHKRKSPESLQGLGSASEANTTHPELNKSSAENRVSNYMRMSSFPISDDGECASSVLTEEQEPNPEVMDMEQLEAELESELQKLPWCITEARQQEALSNLGEGIVSEVSAQGFHELEGQGGDTQQFNGVLPAQLDQKLCHVLIEQQESQIGELESELHSAQSKLQEKETELQALKDCVKRLTEISLSNLSDDENEACIEQDQTTNWNYNMEVSESSKPTVGMKRPIESQSSSYQA